MPRLCSSMLLSLLIASSASAVTMEWTPIGNPGNAAYYFTGWGAVDYDYSIGTYEVTNAQYAEFLNAKAKSDPLGLYDTRMDPSYYDQLGPSYYGLGGIARSGSDGSYTYNAIVGREEMPVNDVSFYDALRFANWMNNGQGDGDTETGAYTLIGITETPSNRAPGNGGTVTRNADATIVLPSRDEWYKAAYHDAIGLTATDYFFYPAGSNERTICVDYPTAAPNHANCGWWPGYPLAVGSYPGSPSPYGTFDQGGNVEEWTDTRFPYSEADARWMQGGSFYNGDGIGAACTCGQSQWVSYPPIGFRLAMVPEPGTGVLVIAGLLGLAGWRRARA